MPKTRLISPGSIPNHRLLKNLQLNNNYISNDGGDEGITIDNIGGTKITSNSTTTDALLVEADSLTTGTAINISADDSLTSSATKKLLFIDYNKSGVTGAVVISNTTGLAIDMVDAATNNTIAIVDMVGAQIDIDSASAIGSITQKGLVLNVAADGTGDTSKTFGIEMEIQDGGTDIKCKSSAEIADYFQIATGGKGATTLTTVDSGSGAGDGTEADLTLNIDGDITLEAAGNITLDAGGGTIDFEDDSVNLAALTAGRLLFGNAANALLAIDLTNSGTDGRDLTIEAGSAPTGSADQSGGALILKAGGGDGTGTSAMTFSTKVSGTDAVAERMRIHTNGYVGIGVDDPDAALEIESTTNPQFKMGYNEDESFTIGIADGGATTIQTHNGNLYFDSSGSIVMMTGFVFNSVSSKLMWGGSNQAINVQSSNITVDSAGAFKIDKNTAGDDAEDAVGLWVDFDRTVATSDTAAHNDIGIDLDIDSSSLGTSTVKGMDIDVVGDDGGTHTATGIDLNVSDSDICNGLKIDVTAETTAVGIHLDNQNGGKDFQNVSSANGSDYFMLNTIAAGATTLSTNDASVGGTAHLTIDADGYVQFAGCGVGFDKISYTDATNVTVDFRTGNKAELDMAGGDISGTLSLKFPDTSGNFLLVVKQDGSARTIANFATLDSGGAAGNNDSGTAGAVRWAGGNPPDLTDGSNKDDILTFYWDADLEVCYGVATLNF